uniref:NADH:ubiquinone reductase (H(+)-translocating) n=1 Tax=Lates calcarifer TaxID=8187 RepID=A0A4W6BZF2_LATCA
SLPPPTCCPPRAPTPCRIFINPNNTIPVPNLLHILLKQTMMGRMYASLLSQTPPLWSSLMTPKSTHVEAPVAGSMILAAVLLKLGGYGIISKTSLLHQLTSPIPIPKRRPRSNYHQLKLNKYCHL